jgi:type I restriction enzyme S subunit
VKIKKKDLMFTGSGETKEDIGKCIVYLGEGVVSVGGDVIIFSPKRFDSLFLSYALNSNCCIYQRARAGKGEIVVHIYASNLRDLLLPLGSVHEQTQIENYLDNKTAQIDDLIAKKEKLIKLLEEEKTAVINEAVTKGINPNVKLKDSGIEWLGKIPEHWEVKKLKYIAKKVQTGSTPPSNQEEYYKDEINWYTPSDFSDNLLLSASKRKVAHLAVAHNVVKLFPVNSVLVVGIGATLGKVGYIDIEGTSNQQINSISFSTLDKAKYYAKLFFVKRQSIVALSNASTLAILNQAQIKDIFMLFPKEKEIVSINQYIETETTRIDKTIETTKKLIELLKEYRTALISEAVTGKIKVFEG